MADRKTHTDSNVISYAYSISSKYESRLKRNELKHIKVIK
jgi:hypothetical protein